MKTAHLYEGKKDKKHNVGEKKESSPDYNFHQITAFISRKEFIPSLISICN